MVLELIPLDCGRITDVELSAHQYFRCFGERTTACSVLWLILGGPHPVVVDFGPGSPQLVAERFGRTFRQVQTPQDAVRAHGVDPADVGTVVLTHLHWDHASGWDLDPFPNAAVHLQREEIRYAAAPLPPHERLYDPVLMRRLLPTYASELPNLVVVDGDYQLFDGVRLLHAPGHTPGSQAVLVETGGGRRLIASDNVPFAGNLQGPNPADWIPSGTHVSLLDVHRTLSRFADQGALVIPSHDEQALGMGWRTADEHPTAHPVTAPEES